MSKPRQVIVIMADSQRQDMVGCYGVPQVNTPYLDRLADSGTRFDRAYTPSPVCAPARAATFTGTYPHTNGCFSNESPLGTYIKTLGQRLTDEGIHSAYIGKWHVDAFDYFGRGEAPEGWDPNYWYDMRNYLEELSPEERVRSREALNEEDPVEASFTFGHRCASRAISFIEAHAEEDFFLVVSFDEPHHPWLCPQEYLDMHRETRFPKKPNVTSSLEDKPELQKLWGQETERLRGPRDRHDPSEYLFPFLACNSFIDSEIGRIIKAIDEQTSTATIIYLSDHGDMAYSHGLYFKGACMYDENILVPLLIRSPEQSDSGQVYPHPVSLIDILPTVLDIFDIEQPPNLEGVSLMPGLRNPASTVREYAFSEFTRFEIRLDMEGGFQPIRCIIDARYKLAINLLDTDELYDLQEDPFEMKNRIHDPELEAVRIRLHDRLLDWMHETRDPFRGYQWEQRPWRRDLPPPTWRGRGQRRPLISEKGEPRRINYPTGLEDR